MRITSCENYQEMSTLAARKIIFLMTGKDKKVYPELPASFLWEHPQVDCLMDLSSMDLSSMV